METIVIMTQRQIYGNYFSLLFDTSYYFFQPILGFLEEWPREPRGGPESRPEREPQDLDLQVMGSPVFSPGTIAKVQLQVLSGWPVRLLVRLSGYWLD